MNKEDRYKSKDSQHQSCLSDQSKQVDFSQVHSKRVYIAGHAGMVGSAISRALTQSNARDFLHTNLSFIEQITRDRTSLDLINQAQVENFLANEKPDEIYIAAAKVGGILENQRYPADFLYENLMVEANVIHGAFKAGVKRLLFLGSSCIYPRLAIQPMTEEALLTGTLEPTNEAYAIAKIAGIKLCESFNRQYGLSHGLDYRSVMPTNLYGPGDNYHPDNSHVIPALIRRFHDAVTTDAQSVVIWGSGNARREFLFVEDLAQACIFVMGTPKSVYDSMTESTRSHLNVGFGADVSIAELASIIAQTVGYTGRIVFDTSKPDGTPRKLISSKRLFELGWKPKYSLLDGLKITYHDFLRQLSKGTLRGA
jgi:GDP-L-fucose synthase